MEVTMKPNMSRNDDPWQFKTSHGMPILRLYLPYIHEMTRLRHTE
jgi:hypothetical protein